MGLESAGRPTEYLLQCNYFADSCTSTLLSDPRQGDDDDDNNNNSDDINKMVCEHCRSTATRTPRYISPFFSAQRVAHWLGRGKVPAGQRMTAGNVLEILNDRRHRSHSHVLYMVFLYCT